ncbi:MAG: transketolase [bacterium]|nr:transketolase [bacterium]
MQPAITIEALKARALSVRRNVLTMAARVKGSHVGGSFSVADILTALYFSVMHIDPKKPKLSTRDRLILSKGHCAAALYAVLVERGFAPKRILQDYFKNGKLLTCHPTRDCMPGVEASTGSLGHGLSMGAGIAYAAKVDGAPYRTFVILSDGECDEGSTWEAAMSAAHFKLDNLVAVVDYNKWQGFGRTDDVLSLEPFRKKWEAFGWAVKEINGHDFNALLNAFGRIPFIKNKPSVVIANTIKGKGVSFMEDTLDWHYKYPQGEEFTKALQELQ